MHGLMSQCLESPDFSYLLTTPQKVSNKPSSGESNKLSFEENGMQKPNRIILKENSVLTGHSLSILLLARPVFQSRESF